MDLTKLGAKGRAASTAVDHMLDAIAGAENADPVDAYRETVRAYRAIREALRAARRNRNRRERDQAMRDLGLTKVRGALRGVYWE